MDRLREEGAWHERYEALRADVELHEGVNLGNPCGNLIHRDDKRLGRLSDD